MYTAFPDTFRTQTVENSGHLTEPLKRELTQWERRHGSLGPHLISFLHGYPEVVLGVSMKGIFHFLWKPFGSSPWKWQPKLQCIDPFIYISEIEHPSQEWDSSQQYFFKFYHVTVSIIPVIPPHPGRNTEGAYTEIHFGRKSPLTRPGVFHPSGMPTWPHTALFWLAEQKEATSPLCG